LWPVNARNHLLLESAWRTLSGLALPAPVLLLVDSLFVMQLDLARAFQASEALPNLIVDYGRTVALSSNLFIFGNLRSERSKTLASVVCWPAGKDPIRRNRESQNGALKLRPASGSWKFNKVANSPSVCRFTAARYVTTLLGMAGWQPRVAVGAQAMRVV
jgi:hypothetical protein